MIESEFEKITKKIKLEIAKRFSIVDAEMKKDLFQEAFLACLEAESSSDEQIHWVIVRSLSKFYWANISIVRRIPVKKKKPKHENTLAPIKEDRQEIFDLSLEDSGLTEVSIEFSEKSDEAIKRVSREFFLIPQAKKTLSSREWEIIKKRIITPKKGQVTRSEIGKSLEISTERVRQIEMNGLNKLRGFLGNPENPLNVLHPGY